MLIALPPSEGKTAPSTGPTLEWDCLSLPALNPTRMEIAGRLMEVSAREDALDLLKVPLGAAGEVADQMSLMDLPCAPAHKVYTGVLFQALDCETLPADARERARDSVLIFSALFGATGPEDLICRYRLTMSSMLGGQSAKALWKDAWHYLDEVEDDLVIDGRSGAYAAWKPKAAYHVSVGAVRESGGARKVVSHNAKHYRGLIARQALLASSVPSRPDDLADLGSDLGLDIELTEVKGRHVLTVVDHV